MIRDFLRNLGGRKPQPARDRRAEGNAALERGDLEEAERCYRAAAAADPRDPLAHLNLGFVLLERDPAAATEPLQQAIALRAPGDDFVHEAHYLLGRARALLGQQEAALAEFAQATRLRPGFAPACEAGLALLQAQGRGAEAVTWAEAWAAADANPASLLALAQALHRQRRNAEALAPIEAVLAAHPGHAQALEGRANVLLALDRPRDALADFDALAAAGARSAHLLSNRASALHRCGDLQEALRTVDAALALDGEHRDALYNRARILLDLHRLPEAEATSSRALALQPDDADLRWNRAIIRLVGGDYEHGWHDYEARWKAAAAGRGDRADAGVPWWTGAEDLDGRRILVHREQGLGDTIQFVRYVSLLQDRGARVVLNVSPALQPLLQAALPGCELVSAGAITRPDFQCMLMSLPLAFRTTLATVPASVPYLHSRPELRATWAERLGPRRGPRVGVVWSGGAAFGNDARRSIPLERFRAIDVPGVEFISLQKEVRDSDQAAMKAWPALGHHGESLHSFADTAALAEQVDVVVSVDTSVAHLAGALGRPLWVLLPHAPDWRWMLGREDSPWYPTARLFRQSVAGDWDGVLARVRAALLERAGAEGR